MYWNRFSLDLSTFTNTMECGKVIVTPGYPIRLDLISGQISIGTTTYPFMCLCQDSLTIHAIIFLSGTIYVMIYKDEKIECEKWRATVTATLDTATMPGTIQTLMTASMVTVS